jgi:hypothetical protein
MSFLNQSDYCAKYETSLRIQKFGENYNSYNRFYMTIVYMDNSGKRTGKVLVDEAADTKRET